MQIRGLHRLRYQILHHRHPHTSNCQLPTMPYHQHSERATLNAYGAAYKAAGRNSGAFGAIKSNDSDGDGFTNLVEIQARTFPGNAADKPFTVGGTMSGLTGSVTLQNNGGDNLVRTPTALHVRHAAAHRQWLCGDGVQSADRADLHGHQWQRHHRGGQRHECRRDLRDQPGGHLHRRRQYLRLDRAASPCRTTAATTWSGPPMAASPLPRR